MFDRVLLYCPGWVQAVISYAPAICRLQPGREAADEEIAPELKVNALMRSVPFFETRMRSLVGRLFGAALAPRSSFTPSKHRR